jgi:hypothetical protein
MKRFLLAISLFAVISVSQLSPLNAYVKNQQHTSIKILEWSEYVLIEDQWYEIIHLDDGNVIIKPVATPIKD